MAAVAMPPSLEVGVLYIVYAHATRRNAKASRLRQYLAEAASSARRMRALNPLLPVFLSTTQQLPKPMEEAFGRVLRLAPASAVEPLWAPRLRALAASPFGLTLALDSHATACSSSLHAALTFEARRKGVRYDLATNVEATACLPPTKGRAGLGRLFFPRTPAQMLPHNFAMVLRKGAGLDALLAMWRDNLGIMHADRQSPDDQWALALTLRRLNRTGGCSIVGASRCRQHSRIWRLSDTFAAGFKSASKRCLGFFPRYTRLLTPSPVLVTHMLKPFPWRDSGTPRDACALLNAQPHLPRLALLPSKSSSYEMLFNASSCWAALRAHTTAPRAAAMTAPICRMLPEVTASPAPPAAPAVLAEPMEDFWQRTKRLRARTRPMKARWDGC